MTDRPTPTNQQTDMRVYGQVRFHFQLFFYLTYNSIKWLIRKSCPYFLKQNSAHILEQREEVNAYFISVKTYNPLMVNSANIPE